jgi:hypothetical protein
LKRLKIQDVAKGGRLGGLPPKAYRVAARKDKETYREFSVREFTVDSDPLL